MAQARRFGLEAADLERHVAVDHAFAAAGRDGTGAARRGGDDLAVGLHHMEAAGGKAVVGADTAGESVPVDELAAGDFGPEVIGGEAVAARPAGEVEGREFVDCLGSEEAVGKVVVGDDAGDADRRPAARFGQW